MHLFSLSIIYACPYHNPTATHGPLDPQRWHQQTAHPHDAMHAVCHLPFTVKIGIQPWREHLSNVPDAIECEHLPTQVGYDDELQSGRDPRWGWRSCWWASLRWFLTVCAEILWLCNLIVAAAVMVAGLSRSWRWRCWMWRSWAGVVTRGLQLWGQFRCTAKLPETPLETAYGREMNIQFTGNSSGGHSCSQHANCTLSQNLQHLWHCAVIKLHILKWPFIVASLSHTCASCAIMLFNQHLDMPNMWGGLIISAKKCSLTHI